MKSRFGAIGNINMRGRKYLRLGCGCCAMQDFRDLERERHDQQDIDEALTHTQYQRRLQNDREFVGYHWLDESVDWEILELHYDFQAERNNASVVQW